MGLTEKTAAEWRGWRRFAGGSVAAMAKIAGRAFDAAGILPCVSDLAVRVLEEASQPRSVTRLEVLAAGLLEPKTELTVNARIWLTDLAVEAGLWDRARRGPTKAGAELLRRVREAAADGRLPKPRRAG